MADAKHDTSIVADFQHELYLMRVYTHGINEVVGIVRSLYLAECSREIVGEGFVFLLNLSSEASRSIDELSRMAFDEQVQKAVKSHFDRGNTDHP